jgi:hypothetical protein
MKGGLYGRGYSRNPPHANGESPDRRGFIGAIVVVVIGLAAVVWLISAGAARQAPSDVARNTEASELLGPGGLDDPGRP